MVHFVLLKFVCSRIAFTTCTIVFSVYSVFLGCLPLSHLANYAVYFRIIKHFCVKILYQCVCTQS